MKALKTCRSTTQEEVNEVSEDLIATITIDEIQRTLKEDVNIIYDALVASDYIEEITEAWTTQRLHPRRLLYQHPRYHRNMPN